MQALRFLLLPFTILGCPTIASSAVHETGEGVALGTTCIVAGKFGFSLDCIAAKTGGSLA